LLGGAVIRQFGARKDEQQALGFDLLASGAQQVVEGLDVQVGRGGRRHLAGGWSMNVDGLPIVLALQCRRRP
jgi:hypothetical protein